MKALFQAYLRPGHAVVMLDPSYAMYGVYARMFQAQQIPIPFDERLEPDLDKLMASVTPGVRIVMISNPNQPTGTMIAEEVSSAGGKKGYCCGGAWWQWTRPITRFPGSPYCPGLRSFRISLSSEPFRKLQVWLRLE